MIAAKVAQELETEAKARSAQNLRNSGDTVDGTNLPHRGEGRSTEQAANLLNVSPSAAKKATKIAKSATEELVQAVTDGTVSLDAAAKVANLPKAKQRTLVKKGEVQEEAKKIRNAKAASKVSPKVAPKSEPIAKSNDDEQPPREPPPTRKVDAVPQAAAEPPEAKPQDTNEEDADDPDDRAPSATDELPLLNEAHTELDKMVAAARRVGRLESALKQLRSLIEHCQKKQVQYEEIALA
jgi:hypothetical protein